MLRKIFSRSRVAQAGAWILAIKSIIGCIRWVLDVVGEIQTLGDLRSILDAVSGPRVSIGIYFAGLVLVIIAWVKETSVERKRGRAGFAPQEKEKVTVTEIAFFAALLIIVAVALVEYHWPLPEPPDAVRMSIPPAPITEEEEWQTLELLVANYRKMHPEYRNKAAVLGSRVALDWINSEFSKRQLPHVSVKSRMVCPPNMVPLTISGAIISDNGGPGIYNNDPCEAISVVDTTVEKNRNGGIVNSVRR